jgi:hypothetical protein
LEQQVDRVTIIPTKMNTEELSKIWSVLFQTPYVLSFACQGGAVLIEGNKHSPRALPVKSVQFYTTPNQPMVEEAISESGANQPIVAGSILMIRGKLLQADGVQVRIGETRVTPQEVSEKELRLNLSLLPEEEKQSLRAGVQQLCVLHPIVKLKPLDPDRAIASNVVPFVLCPQIVGKPEVLDLWGNEEDLYGAEFQVQVDLTIGRDQRVLLFLNERSNNNPVGYIFTAKPRDEPIDTVVFPILDVKGGEYLVRVQIDGAESPLEVDGDSGYVSPCVVIG